MYKISFLLFVIFMGCTNATKKTQAKESVKIGQDKNIMQSDLEKSMERGATVYSDFCVQCHLPNGKGIPNNFPPLAGSNWLTEKRTESIHAVKYGQTGEIEVNGITYNGVMTPMGLSEQEVADVLNYVMNSWGNTQKEMVTKDEVNAVSK